MGAWHRRAVPEGTGTSSSSSSDGAGTTLGAGTCSSSDGAGTPGAGTSSSSSASEGAGTTLGAGTRSSSASDGAGTSSASDQPGRSNSTCAGAGTGAGTGGGKAPSRRWRCALDTRASKGAQPGANRGSRHGAFNLRGDFRRSSISNWPHSGYMNWHAHRPGVPYYLTSYYYYYYFTLVRVIGASVTTMRIGSAGRGMSAMGSPW